MRQVKLPLILGIFIAGFATQVVAQDVKTLPEVVVEAKNYKYLRSVDNKNDAEPVKILERKAAAYDVKNSEFYDDDNETYYISFYLPEGYVLAVYDKDGKLLRTAERFKDIDLPPAVRKAVVNRFPQWKISKDIYLVKYNEPSGAKKDYKLILENGSKRLRVKTDENGEFH